jgi:hypothetical protein
MDSVLAVGNCANPSIAEKGLERPARVLADSAAWVRVVAGVCVDSCGATLWAGVSGAAAWAWALTGTAESQVTMTAHAARQQRVVKTDSFIQTHSRKVIQSHKKRHDRLTGL